MDRCKTIEDVIKRIEYDSIEYIRFEASDCNGRSFGKTVPVRHIKSVFKKGLAICCGTWFFTASYGLTLDASDDGLTYRNAFGYPYPDTYTIIPYSKSSKIARIMMHPYINNLTKEVWPCDPRTICLQQLSQLKAMGFDLYSSFEHEFQMIDNATDEPLWSGKEYCSNNKFTQHQDFAFALDKYLYKMGVDVEVMHVEYSPGQYELPMVPEFGIYAADNSFTFRNAIKQIAQQNDYLATFATTPFPAQMNGASNGTHFNFSLWKDSADAVDAKDNDEIIYLNEDDTENTDNKGKTNAFCDENTATKLSEIAMYFMGGVLKHIDALTVFANGTPNCFRRSIAHSWSPGNVSWGRNNRSVLMRVKTDGQSGTYMEYRLPCAACNPYMVMTSLVAAGIDGIKNKIKPKYKECVKDAWDEEYQHLPKIVPTMKEALKALKDDKVIWNAFGDRFCTMLINVKELELKELDELAKKIGQEQAETNMFLDI
eukprot:489466_1